MSHRNCCSFCGQFGHNIRACIEGLNASGEIHEEMKSVYVNIMQNFISRDDDSLREFNQQMQCYGVEEMKVVLLHHTGITTLSLSKQILIRRIWDHFAQIEVHVIRTPLPRQPDSVPHYAQDINMEQEPAQQEASQADLLESHYPLQEDLFDTIIYYIDRIPTRIGLVQRNLYYEFTQEQRKYNFTLSLNGAPIGTNTIECPLCLDEEIETANSIKLGCNHQYCSPCFIKLLENSQLNNITPNCSCCRGEIKIIEANNQQAYQNIQVYCV